MFRGLNGGVIIEDKKMETNLDFFFKYLFLFILYISLKKPKQTKPEVIIFRKFHQRLIQIIKADFRFAFFCNMIFLTRSVIFSF
jgi:hypothetical protein